MNDQQLLELAAKAAGQVQLDPFRGVFRHVIDMGFLGGEWNPLADDRDAFRLAIKLEFLPYLTMIMRAAEKLERLPYHDEYAAWRRAIVLAAAEKGRQMP